MDRQDNKLRFYITAPHPCNYLEQKEANSLFVDPLFPKDKSLYSALVETGFRRSGEHLYKPYCSACSECVPVRIPVKKFKLNRNQNRAWNKNRDLVASESAAEFNEEHFRLYTAYLSARHADGGMDNPTPEHYRDFLWAAWSDTGLIEFRLKNKLIAVAVVDHLKSALSAVYTFFDPAYSKRSPGKYAILYLIEKAKSMNYQWLYLGYWISACNKMQYKIEYQPLQGFINNEWLNIKPKDGERRTA